MKPKIKVFVIVLVIAVIAGAAFLIFQKLDNYNEQKIEAEYLKKDLPSYSSINIISDFKEKDNNTLDAVKEAVRLGSDTVTLDLCFDKNNRPVITDSYDKINDDSLTLEELFKFLQSDKYAYVQLNLRLRQLGSTEIFNKLVSDNSMSGRIIVSGIDKSRYGILQGDKIAANVFYDYAPSGSPEEALTEIKQMIAQYNITGIIIENKNITEELIETLNNSGISYIVKDVNKKSEMYKAIDIGVGFIQTKNAAELNELYENWKQITQEKIDKEIISNVK